MSKPKIKKTKLRYTIYSEIDPHHHIMDLHTTWLWHLGGHEVRNNILYNLNSSKGNWVKVRDLTEEEIAVHNGFIAIRDYYGKRTK
ncbi:MAG: hypothetical protein KDH96_12305 [Candidatus Riesia sp.]|nr:hypothetical protein [Candidatus Riesia sp.]